MIDGLIASLVVLVMMLIGVVLYLTWHLSRVWRSSEDLQRQIDEMRKDLIRQEGQIDNTSEIALATNKRVGRLHGRIGRLLEADIIALRSALKNPTKKVVPQRELITEPSVFDRLANQLNLDWDWVMVSIENAEKTFLQLHEADRGHWRKYLSQLVRGELLLMTDREAKAYASISSGCLIRILVKPIDKNRVRISGLALWVYDPDRGWEAMTEIDHQGTHAPTTLIALFDTYYKSQQPALRLLAASGKSHG